MAIPLTGMKIIWCQGGNPNSARLARAAGWHYGFRSDSNHYASELGPVALLDSHWIDPDWSQHLVVAAEVQPWLAAVPDTLALSELDRTIRQAEEIAVFSCPLIIPKCPGIIERLPRKIDGRPVILGYSIPTSYGGTELGLWSFQGWPVHLLGGSAVKQADLCQYLDVVSADGNVAWLLARRGIVVTELGRGGNTIRQEDGSRWPGEDGHLEALRRSLINLRVFWGKRRKIDWAV